MISGNDIIISLQDHSPKYVYGCYPIKPQGIVFHSTGANNPNLKRYVDAPEELGVNQYQNWFGGPNSNDVVPHGAIGLDKNGKVRIAQILPYELACQCAGKGSKGSYNIYDKDKGYIQFETAEDDLKDENYFNAAMDAAADYCVYLMKLYPDIKVENIVSHNEAHERGMASGHVDPEHWMKNFGKDMDWFRDIVKQRLAEPEPETETFYRVQVGAFKIRANAEDMLAKLKADGYTGFIVESEV